ncbi:unnamed protein product [Microthlaspi erraticum]|uniref:Uncharacterized protein n=1 Tax=Microthlaspi erraticum TaxID=1685480 RepID=A0A6D2IJW9_9BRAS|nr:unnamed protein product [Microthlaspi erraticum]
MAAFNPCGYASSPTTAEIQYKNPTHLPFLFRREQFPRLEAVNPLSSQPRPRLSSSAVPMVSGNPLRRPSQLPSNVYEITGIHPKMGLSCFCLIIRWRIFW